MKKLILASSSPRRKKIFEDLNLDFEIIPSSYEEKLENHDFSYDKIENLGADGIFDKIGSFFSNLFSSIADFFKNLFS